MTHRTIYELTLERTSTDPTPVLKRFKRADSAHYAARQLAYELIKAEARLDTQVGHAFAHAVDAWEVSPPRQGYVTEWYAVPAWLAQYGARIMIRAYRTQEA